MFCMTSHWEDTYPRIIKSSPISRWCCILSLTKSYWSLVWKGLWRSSSTYPFLYSSNSVVIAVVMRGAVFALRKSFIRIVLAFFKALQASELIHENMCLKVSALSLHLLQFGFWSAFQLAWTMFVIHLLCSRLKMDSLSCLAVLLYARSSACHWIMWFV